MAFTRTPITRRLQVRFNMGLDEDLNPIYSLRSWSHINEAATDQNLFFLGNYISELTDATKNEIRIVETDAIEED